MDKKLVKNLFGHAYWNIDLVETTTAPVCDIPWGSLIIDRVTYPGPKGHLVYSICKNILTMITLIFCADERENQRLPNRYRYQFR